LGWWLNSDADERRPARTGVAITFIRDSGRVTQSPRSDKFRRLPV